MRPHFRRHYELISFVVDIAVSVVLASVIVAQQFQLLDIVQEVEILRAEIATIRLNSLHTSNAPYESAPSHSTAAK